MRRRIFSDYERILATDLSLISNEIYSTVLDRLLYRLFDSTSGAVLGTGLEVTRVTATSVSVAAGEAIVKRTTYPAGEPAVVNASLDAPVTLNIAAAHATLGRIDIVVLTPTDTSVLSQVRDVRTEGGGDVYQTTVDKVKEYRGTVSIVTGTAAGSPAAPATPAGSLKLANISVTPANGILDQTAIVETASRHRTASTTSGVSNLASTLRLPNGTASTPSYSFVNGSSTGAYSPAGNDYGVSVLGTLRFFMSTAGTPTFSALTANRALVTGTGGSLVASSVTDTEISKLAGIGADTVATQLAAKANLAGATFTGNISAPAFDSATVNIGTGTATIINIGRAGATTNLFGDLITVQATNSAITDKIVTLNRGGAASTGDDVGIQIQEGGTDASPTITGYVKTANSRSSWDIKAPALAGVFRFTPANNSSVVTFATNASISRTYSFQDATGLVPVIASLATGDIIYASSSTQFVRLGKGAAGQVLTQNAALTAPEWTTPDPGGLQTIDVSSANIGSNTPLTDKRNYLCDTTGGAFTVTLPAGGAKKVIRITDSAEKFATANLTVAPATGEAIDGLAVNETYILDVSGSWAEFSWSVSLSKWVVSTSTATTSVPAIIQGGQSLGVPMRIGTNDNQYVAIESNGIDSIFVNPNGSVQLGAVDHVGTHTSFSGTFTVSRGSALLADGQSSNLIASDYLNTRARIFAYKNANMGTISVGVLGLNNGNSGGEYYLWHYGGIWYTGNQAQNIGTTTGGVIGLQTSDERLKENIRPVPYGLKEALALDPIQFERDGKTEIGYGAQRTRPIIPEAVFDTGDVITEGEPTKLGMAYVNLIPMLHNSIKELHAEIVTLRNEIAILKGDKQ